MIIKSIIIPIEPEYDIDDNEIDYLCNANDALEIDAYKEVVSIHTKRNRNDV